MDWSEIASKGGPAAVFLAFVIYVARLLVDGKFYTKATVDKMQENFDNQIARERIISDRWQEVAVKSAEAIAKLSSQQDRLMESQLVVQQFILSLPRRSEDAPPSKPERQSQLPSTPYPFMVLVPPPQ